MMATTAAAEFTKKSKPQSPHLNSLLLTAANLSLPQCGQKCKNANGSDDESMSCIFLYVIGGAKDRGKKAFIALLPL